ncbi:MAG TPA: DapH/DapD/GlmU-related protein, partial [Acidimicrobiia bacterium]|nr:DapH/DapD/GlmU-related protein [Acidimicrobiia bacterium]
VGSFVEIKNSEIGEGAKVPHLSYVGDAEIGDGSNLGAGTITANYDGTEKHRTKVGKNVRTGSNTVLVAPVEVGDGAYTGAGSVVNRDVPPGALAKGVPARIDEGWVRRSTADRSGDDPGDDPGDPVADRGSDPAGEPGSEPDGGTGD